MALDEFLANEPIVLEGALVNKDEPKYKDVISIQLHPGLIVDVARKQVKSVEEATDPVTGRSFVRITCEPDVELSAVFQSRLARLALRSGNLGTPFGLGGLLPETVPLARPSGTPNDPTKGSTVCWDRDKTTFWTHDWKADDHRNELMALYDV